MAPRGTDDKSEPAGYEVFEHTADVGVRAWGATPAEAFARAAAGMFAVILGRDPTAWATNAEPDETRAVEATGEGWDDLLVNWLAELLFLFEVDGAVPVMLDVRRCEPPVCSATAGMALLAEDAETSGVGVKAVTYHQLRVDISPLRTDIAVILDI